MKRMLVFIAMGGLFVFAGWAFAAEKEAEKAPQKVIDFGEKELVKWGYDPIIVKAVKEENAKKKTLEQVKAMDEKWTKTPGIADYMKAMMESECSKHLITKLLKSQPFFDEIFVMDNLGANVAMTDKTSDYWQGDEDKFKKSFNEGKGGIDIGDVKFDDSTQAYLVQISVPVKEVVDKETKKEIVIGAITIGINIDKFK
ncbi:MAG: cache domain-containing protein [Candidatus Omnitrophota bacterium]